MYAYSAANGCLTNLLETSSFRNSLDQNFYQQTESANDADVIFVNTCGYSDEAEKNSLNAITNFQTQFPEKKIIVSGCLPRINKSAIEKSFSGPIIAGSDIAQLNSILNETVTVNSVENLQGLYLDRSDLNTRLSENKLIEKTYPIFKKVKKIFNDRFKLLDNIFESTTFDKQTFAVSVSTGCLGKCNYCSIKKAKGKLISRPLPAILKDIELALTNGANKIHLLGDDVGCWGQDFLLNSSHLLSAILKLNYDFKIVINYFDPTWLNKHFDELLVPLSNPKIICVNFPIQSGSDAIIKKMDRDYIIADVLNHLSKIKENNPYLVLKTHLMVGYPTESLADFSQSIDKLNKFDLIFANKFGARPHTPAEKMPQLSNLTKTVRFNLLKFKIALRHIQVLFRSYAS